MNCPTCENEMETYRFCQRCLTSERLEGTPPQGNHRRLDRGHAEREPEQGGDTDSATAAPIGGQGTGELQRLLEYLEDEAENMEALATPMEGEDPRVPESAEQWAADFRLWASLVRGAIGSPRPQSGADGGESCRECEAPLCLSLERETGICALCRMGGTGSRKERSGPPISELSQPPVE